MSIVRGRDGTVYVPSALTAFSSQATTEASYIYQINNAGMRIWDPNTAIVVSATAGTVDTLWMFNGFDYFTGRVKLTATGATVAVSGSYVSTLTAVADIHGWQLQINRAMEDTTPLNAAWRDVTALGLDAKVTLLRWRTDTQFDYVTALDSVVLIKLDEDGSHGFWVTAIRSQLSWNKAVGKADQEAVTLDVDETMLRY
jgi:hypothetical protein